jgi:hypothetical protein
MAPPIKPTKYSDTDYMYISQTIYSQFKLTSEIKLLKDKVKIPIKINSK